MRKVAGHRVLALNRGEKEKILTVKINAPEEEILGWLCRQVIKKDNPNTTPVLKEVVEDSYKRPDRPCDREGDKKRPYGESGGRSDPCIRKESGTASYAAAHCRKSGPGMGSSFPDRMQAGWWVDATGKVLDTTVIYPTAPTTEAKIRAAKDTLKKLIHKYGISLISLGNGTASRESEQIIVDLLKEIPEKVSYVITNEAGASVYSASKLATEEFPNFDVGQRSAASIARRLQDPLAELVKIDPRSIGSGTVSA